MREILYRIEIKGEEQLGQAGLPLQPLLVKVTYAENGTPVHKLPVRFRLIKGTGSFEHRDALTDVRGEAIAEFVPDGSGPYRIDCRVGSERKNGLVAKFVGNIVEHAASPAPKIPVPIPVPPLPELERQPLVVSTPSLVEAMHTAVWEQEVVRPAAGQGQNVPPPETGPATDPAATAEPAPEPEMTVAPEAVPTEPVPGPIAAAEEATDSNIQAAVEAGQATVEETAQVAAPAETPVIVTEAAGQEATKDEPALDPIKVESETSEDEPVPMRGGIRPAYVVIGIVLALLLTTALAWVIKRPASGDTAAEPVTVQAPAKVVDCSGVKPREVGHTYVFENCAARRQ